MLLSGFKWNWMQHSESSSVCWCFWLWRSFVFSCSFSGHLLPFWSLQLLQYLPVNNMMFQTTLWLITNWSTSFFWKNGYVLWNYAGCHSYCCFLCCCHFLFGFVCRLFMSFLNLCSNCNNSCRRVIHIKLIVFTTQLQRTNMSFYMIFANNSCVPGSDVQGVVFWALDFNRPGVLVVLVC